jgi:hypothetical protein
MLNELEFHSIMFSSFIISEKKTGRNPERDLFDYRSPQRCFYTHFGEDHIEYYIDSPCSPDGNPGTYRIMIRYHEERKLDWTYPDLLRLTDGGTV